MLVMLLCSSRRGNQEFMQGQGSENPVDFTGDVSLEAADDLLFGLAFGGALSDVGSGALVMAHATDSDHVECPVGVTVAMAVQTMADRLTRGRRNWRDTTQVRKGCLISQTLRVIAGGDQ